MPGCRVKVITPDGLALLFLGARVIRPRVHCRPLQCCVNNFPMPLDED